MATNAEPHRRDDILDRSIGDLLARGTVAGLFSGFVFLLATMAYVASTGKPPAAPLAAISTIFHNTDRPMPAMTPFGADNLVVGFITHLSLTLVFGIGFAILAALLLREVNVAVLAAAGVVYGLVLYVVNFQVFGRVFFEWFTDPMGPPQGFEIFAHAVFGLLLVPFFMGAGRGLPNLRK